MHRVDHLAGADEKVTALSQDIAAGGPATGAALTFAALGGTATLVTAVGHHPLGDVIRTDLADYGVRLIDVSQSIAPPAVSTVQILAATGERSVCSVDATGGVPVAVPVQPPHDLATLAGAVDVVLYDGHHPGLGAAVATAVAATGVPLVLDAGRWRPAFATVLPVAEFVVASAAFTVEDRRATALDLITARTTAAAVTNGGRPIDWATTAGTGVIEVVDVDGGDTLGAGDAFHGAVSFAVAAVGRSVAQRRWSEVLRWAAEVTAVRVASAGPREWLRDARLEREGNRWTA